MQSYFGELAVVWPLHISPLNCWVAHPLRSLSRTFVSEFENETFFLAFQESCASSFLGEIPLSDLDQIKHPRKERAFSRSSEIKLSLFFLIIANEEVFVMQQVGPAPTCFFFFLPSQILTLTISFSWFAVFLCPLDARLHLTSFEFSHRALN